MMTKLAALGVAAAVGTVTPTSTFPPGPISPRTSHEIAKLDAVASSLAGKRVTVNCWSYGDWRRMVAAQVHHGYARLAEAAAFTNSYRAQIQMGPDSCVTLAKILAGREAPELDAAIAVGLIAHESRHAAGVRDEAAAECGGMRTLPQAALLLGFPAEQATRLLHVYRGTVYPLDAPEYRSSSCRAGVPGISVPNEFGPDASVARLRSHVRAIGSSLSWSRLPAPPAGPLSRCSPIRSRMQEIARVEQLYRRGSDLLLDIAAAELRTTAEVEHAFAGTKRSFACLADEAKTRLRRIDPAASVSNEPLPSSDSNRAAGVRTTMRSKALGRAGIVVQDLILVVDRRRRTFVALVFRGAGVTPAAEDEARAVHAALR
jgi:hypothetical protein